MNPTTFADFNLSPEILKSLQEMGFETPTPIQAMTIPKLLTEGSKDLVGLASTGTGKTAAFGIPALENVDAKNKSIQVLIMSPTRELAQQVGQEINVLGKYTGKKAVVINGGASYSKQISDLKRGAQICVATPGRLIDLMEQNVLSLKDVRTVILDEADEMISMGFREHIENILEQVPERQTWLFSATMNHQIQRVSQKYLNKPHHVQLNREEGVNPLIENYYFTVKNENKVTALQRLLLRNPDFFGIIFCQTKAEVADIEAELRSKGLVIESLHGDKKQREREIVLQKLKSKQVHAVVATDVAARGLDVKELTHVVNFSLPWDSETFVHRSGRTGRNNQKGITWTFISPAQLSLLNVFQKKLNSSLKKGTVPSIADSLVERVQELVKPRLEKLALEPVQFKMNKFFEKFKDSEAMATLTALSSEEILKLWFMQEFPEILDRDHSVEFEERPPRERSGSFRSDRGGRSGRFGSDRDRGGFRSERGGDRPYRPNAGGGGGGGFRSDRGGDRPFRARTEDDNNRPQWSGDKPERAERPRRFEGGGDRPAFADRPRRTEGEGSAPPRSFKTSGSGGSRGGRQRTRSFDGDRRASEKFT